MPILAKFYYYLDRAYQLDVYDRFRKKYQIHKTFIFNGDGILMYGEGIIEIDEDSYIGRYSLLQVSKNQKIIIGKKCKIGPFFSVWTESTQVDYDYNLPELIPSKLGDIIINDAVWIGANVLISPGVTIGPNSVVGANSVVTKDVPAYAIVGGVPAQIIRYKKINPYE